MNIPDLAGVIDAKDVHTKGGGSFKAKYMAWAKIKQLLNKHAPGWEFHLLNFNEDSYVWPAPDGTGYLMCFFSGPDQQQTSQFPFPIMDNRNMPVKIDKISARTFTDSHRRALCAASAFHFSLGFELWCDEEISEQSVPTPTFSTPAPVTDSKPQRKAPERIPEKEKTDLINYMKLWAKENSQGFEDLKIAYGTKFPDFNDLEKPSFNIHVYFPAHAEFIQDFIKNYE